ncbi:MAG: hypothetical protein HC915_10925 [Anaerolineae bacterium]|nr:hypothetical protein [Anaerolineae bacterium]
MSPIQRANFNHLVWDIAWFGFALAATTRFLSVFAIRSGATAFELALMAALPAVGLLLSAGWAAQWLGRFSDPIVALRWPALIFRMQFLLPVFTPFFPAALQPAWLVMAVTLPAFAQGVAGVTFIIMMRQVIPVSAMTALLSRRFLAMNGTLAFSALGFGLWLENVAFPYNYQVMFLAAFGLSLVSWHHCNRIQVDLEEALPTAELRPKAAELPWQSTGFRAVIASVSAHAPTLFCDLPVVPLTSGEWVARGRRVYC